MATATSTLDARNTIPARLEKLGLSVSAFVGLTGDSKAQMSRYLNGDTRMPADEVERLNSALDVLEKLFIAFHPFRPDLRDGDTCGPLIRDFSKGLITVTVKDDCELIRNNPVAAGGHAALAEGIKNVE